MVTKELYVDNQLPAWENVKVNYAKIFECHNFCQSELTIPESCAHYYNINFVRISHS